MCTTRLFTRLSLTGILLATLAASGCAGGGSGQSSSDSTAKAQAQGNYAFWPAPPDDPHIQFIRSFQGSEDVAPTSNSGLDSIVFGKNEGHGSAINKPYGVAMHAGKIYVCDMRSSTLMVLDLIKKQTRLVGTTGANRLSHPVAVAVAPDGTIYVADNERGAIVVFDDQEKYTQVIGYPKFKPTSLAITGNKVVACDMATQSVAIFDRISGKQLGAFGKVGDNDGEFRLPLGVATDKQGNIYVSDMMRCRVQKFSPDGQFLAGVGTMGDYAGSFARPKHIAVDDDGILYVVDAAFQNVQMFDDKLRLLMSFGAVGTFPGSMDLPAGIAVCEDSTGVFKDAIHPGFNAKRVVLVTNQFGDKKVSVYAMGDIAKGYTAADLSKAAVAVSTGTGIEAESLKLQQALPQAQGGPGSATSTETGKGAEKPPVQAAPR